MLAMENPMKHPAAVLGLVMAAVLAFAPPAARADLVTDWNKTAAAVLRAAKIGGNPASRALAMVHVAMADAVNTVGGRYARYVAALPPAPKASAEAAAASAARTILLGLAPAQKAMIDEAFAASLKAIPDGAAKEEGIAIGEKVAAAVVADRAQDGTSVPDTYRPITSPGVWVPTTPPLFAQYARAKPWVLKSADQFRPAPPPALSSPLYARDYNETKTLGGVKSTARTAEQTAAVKFWSQDNLPSAWQQTARQLVEAKKLPLADSARLFALLTMAAANTFIADWDAKFTYNFWRPVTAIRNGDNDSNEGTERDPGWTPLNATPMHPEYPSQAAIIAGVAVTILEAFFGKSQGMPIVIADIADPKLQRTFKSVAELGEEVRNIRVWGGIHFRNSLDVGYDMGAKIATYMMANTLTKAQ
jgi:hypothetical protein